MAKSKYRVVPGYEDILFIGNIPDGQGGLKSIAKQFKDFTEQELMAYRCYCPKAKQVLGPVVKLGQRDNAPQEPAPVKPSSKKKTKKDEPKEGDTDK